MRGFYVGALGQFIHANAEFNWEGVQIFDEGIDDFGVGGVAGYGWRLGAFYIGPEVFVNYAKLNNNLTNSLIDPDIASLSIDRGFSAGVNLLAGPATRGTWSTHRVRRRRPLLHTAAHGRSSASWPGSVARPRR